jgi:VanZ family protein
MEVSESTPLTNTWLSISLTYNCTNSKPPPSTNQPQYHTIHHEARHTVNGRPLSALVLVVEMVTLVMVSTASSDMMYNACAR